MTQQYYRPDDIIQSVAEALQYISYYHPVDFIRAMRHAYEHETNPPAKAALAQVLYNSRLSAIGKRPICQDTGMVNVYVQLGKDALIEGERTLAELINEGVAQAYTNPDNTLRFSMVEAPHAGRSNTKNNTPAMIHMEQVRGSTIRMDIQSKGAGSENKAFFKVINPTASIADTVVEAVGQMGAGWCPPGVLGIGIGGSSDMAMLLAKRAMAEDIDIHEIIQRGPRDATEALRLEIYEAVNGLGIGAQGLGGMTTVLDVKINQYPTHAASLPIAVIPNCSATRHIHFTLDGKGAAHFEAPDLSEWPEISLDGIKDKARRVDLDHLTPEALADWQIGETLLLSGTIIGARDAAHKRLLEALETDAGLPEGLNLNNRFIYYVGPVNPVRDEAIGPAGPTTASRMDGFMAPLFEKVNLLGTIGKAERGDAVIALMKEKKRVYLIAVGGAAYLIAKAVQSSKIVAYEELGMEAVREMVVKDMPVTVAIDIEGNSIHKEGQVHMRQVIASTK